MNHMQVGHNERNTYKGILTVNKIAFAILPHAAWLVVFAYTLPHKILLVSSRNQWYGVFLVSGANVML
jgi:hypothetical protein